MRCFVLQKEHPGEWSVWSTSPHTGDKKDCLAWGTWHHCVAVGRRYVKGESK